MTGTIESPANPLVKELAGLKQRRNRDRTGHILIEGSRELGHALATDRVVVERIVVSAELAGTEAERFAAAADAGAIPLTRMSAVAFAKLSMRRHPDGIAGVAAASSWTLDRLEPGPKARFLFVEGVEKPGNLGAMLRTADAAGVDGVVVAGAGVDLGSPNVIRASQGSIFDLPIAQHETDAVIRWLQSHRIPLVVATPDAKHALWDIDLTGAVALGVGSEHLGISPATRAAATLVRIPMAGTADSLNVSVAAAVLLYEAVRQGR